MARGGGCGLCTTRVGFRTASDLDVGGDEERPELEVVDGETEEEPVLPGLGAIGIATSTVRLYAGYPSHCLPDRTHLLHCGLVSSHFTLRCLVKNGLAHAPRYTYLDIAAEDEVSTYRSRLTCNYYNPS